MNIISQTPTLVIDLAKTAADRAAAQRLRYDVFADEFGANGLGFDPKNRRETDAFDAHADVLVAKDLSLPVGHDVVGTYRLTTAAHARRAGGFYSAAEFDLSRITESSTAPLEMSRSCIHRDYRGGTTLLQMWKGLSAYVAENGIDVIFGVASFVGADPAAHTQTLALLHQDHLAPAHLRPTATGENAVPASKYADVAVNRRAAMISMPSLIKAYLRMGGTVGEGAYVDAAFGTTDVCMVLETAALNARHQLFLGTS